MRIKNINDLENNKKNKVFYVTELPSLYDVYGIIKDFFDDYSTFHKAKMLFDKASVFPCKLIKMTNESHSGYRTLEDGTGHSFECKESLSYQFESLSWEDAKKLKVPDYYFNFLDICRICEKHRTINGLSVYNNLTMNDGKNYPQYSEVSMLTKDEYKKDCLVNPDDENYLVYFSSPIAVFTDPDEAFIWVKWEIKDIVRKIIDDINKRAEEEKEEYYKVMFKVCNQYHGD